MAQQIRHTCQACGAIVEAWSDGNPYYLDMNGGKHYAYHPDHRALAWCVGNDEPHLCLGCGETFIVDSRAPRDTCPACACARISSTYRMDGAPCPYCEGGAFGEEPDHLAIS